MADNMTASAMTNTALVFLTFMPSPAHIVNSEPDLSLRVNEVSAAAVAIGLGFTLTILSKSGGPLAASLVGTLALILGYEYLAHTTDSRIARERNERVANVRI